MDDHNTKYILVLSVDDFLQIEKELWELARYRQKEGFTEGPKGLTTLFAYVEADEKTAAVIRSFAKL